MKGETVGEAVLVMADDDTVATALEDLEGGREIPTDPPLTVAETIEFGHKVALVDHEAGETVRKYGEPIGEATDPIERGEWVHTHNCESARGRGDRAGADAGDGLSEADQT